MKDIVEKVGVLIDRIKSTREYPHQEIISYLKVMEEIGEVTELVLKTQVKSRKSALMTKEEVKDELSKEIADVIIALLALAHDYGVSNMDKVIVEKLDEHYEKQPK
jgi:NTP pyrophosphatase (non-canonical NTP hydrolase)